MSPVGAAVPARAAGPWRWTRRLRASVRAKLLALVLAPLILGVPVLLALVVAWGNTAYQRLITFKIGADLVTAHEYFDRVRDGVGSNLDAIARSYRLVSVLGRPGIDALLHDSAVVNGLDFVRLVDRQGRVLASSVEGGTIGVPAERRPALAAALDGSRLATIEVFRAEELAAIDPALRARAYQPLVPTPAAAADDRVAETRGLLIHAAVPVFDRHGFVAGALEGGVLLNGNLGIVDRINAIVYREGALPLGSRGTATLFLGTTRIATNVHLFANQRALGTRVSKAVSEAVLGRGETWRGTAFVVNDDYVSGYEPLLDGRGARVGMLYVGFLETPFRHAKALAMGTLFLVFLLISGLGAVLSLRWAHSVFAPIERMDTVMQQVEAGEVEARVGDTASADELGRLAERLDHLLDALAAREAELREWGNALDAKVAERSRALDEAGASLQRAQQQLVLSEKLAAIGELTAGVAHEINNPVAVIQGNLDVLRDILGPTADPVRQEIRLIHQQADRIRQIVTKLLQFARPGEFAGYVERVDVNALIHDCLVLTRHNLVKRRIALELDLAAHCEVEINRSELQQVLINLIVNAVQAMPEGGSLRLSSADALCGDGASAVQVRVADTGHGIAPEHLDRIFDPFFTTKKGSGTGLGLSISYAIVQRYGGEIGVSSTPGQGTEFRLLLRCAPQYEAGQG